ncbi:MAG: hypothetical protein IJT24_02580 [Lachnospiraceae bacterium]|nr:hypothetical protein [Lachnospiraceae bacterium]
MDISIKIRILIMTACSVMFIGLMTIPAFAADDANKTDEKKKDEIDYTLDKEVQDWLNEGNSIPGDAKYATLKCTSHLWMIDSTDISDGKVELTGNNETRILAGIALRDWLKTQSFYGDKLGEPDNKITFKRPQKDKPF